MASAEVFKAGYVINDRFEISRLLGQGGFAMVFEGTDRNLGRKVAIKILHGAVLKSSENDHRVIERFEREAKLAASVDHPSVVNIYDAGEIEGLGEPFIVMEYLKGDSLQDYLDSKGPIEPERLLPLFKDVLMGLGYSHELGIVHKDLKPDNIFYRYPDSMRESLCIVDFGIAHIGRSNSGRVTRDGEFFGTPSYMPPEYIAEQKVSAQFDVYQMGLILIECLTGQSVVYHEDAVATLLMHLNRQFRIPAALLESDAWPVIERAIAANPSLRYKNALGFAEALHSLPASAWPPLSEMTAVPIKEAKVPASMGAGLDEPESDVEDIEFADAWKQEDSYRTTGSSHIATQAGSVPDDLKPYEPSDEHSKHAASIINGSAHSAEITEELPFADGSPSLVDSLASQHSNRLGVIAIAIILLVLCAGGAIAMLSNTEEPKKPKVDGVVVSKQEPKEKLDPPKVEEVPAVVKVDPPVDATPPEPVAEPVQVAISGEPTGALVTDRSGKILGTAPFTITFDSKDANGQIVVVSRKGYRDAELQIVPALASSGAHYELDKIRKRTSSKTVKPPEEKPEKQPVKPIKDKTPKVELPGKTPKKKPEGSGILLPK